MTIEKLDYNSSIVCLLSLSGPKLFANLLVWFILPISMQINSHKFLFARLQGSWSPWNPFLLRNIWGCDLITWYLLFIVSNLFTVILQCYLDAPSLRSCTWAFMFMTQLKCSLDYHLNIHRMGIGLHYISLS